MRRRTAGLGVGLALRGSRKPASPLWRPGCTASLPGLAGRTAGQEGPREELRNQRAHRGSVPTQISTPHTVLFPGVTGNRRKDPTQIRVLEEGLGGDVSPGAEEKSLISPTEKKQIPRLVSEGEVKHPLQCLLLPPRTPTQPHPAAPGQRPGETCHVLSGATCGPFML